MTDDKKPPFFDEDDLDLWRQISSDVTPLKHNHITSETSTECTKQTDPQATQPLSPLTNAPNFASLPYLNVGEMVGVDKSTAKKVKEASFTIEARLDLHGKTQEEAFAALHYFLTTAYAMDKRMVLVITGKGAGVLRGQLPRWINEAGLREMLLYYCHAKPHDGGDGAFYIYLRKRQL